MKCEDDDSPPPTQDQCFDRDAKVSCLIDGVYWETKGGNGINPNVDVYYDDWNHAFILNATSNFDGSYLSIGIFSDLDTNGINYAMTKYSMRFVDSVFNRYQTDTNHLNYLNITNFESNKKCVEGTFQFRAISKDLLDTVTVTDGYFIDRLETN